MTVTSESDCHLGQFCRTTNAPRPVCRHTPTGPGEAFRYLAVPFDESNGCGREWVASSSPWSIGLRSVNRRLFPSPTWRRRGATTPKPPIVVPVPGIVVDAGGAPYPFSVIIPRTAAQHAYDLVATAQLLAPIVRVVGIILVGALTPFPNIAGHVQRTVRTVASRLCGPLRRAAPFGAAAGQRGRPSHSRGRSPPPILRIRALRNGRTRLRSEA